MSRPPKSVAPKSIAPQTGVVAPAHLAGLTARARALHADLARQFEARDLAAAWTTWVGLSLEAPAHPVLLRWSAALNLAGGDADKALPPLDAALRAAPDDPQLLRMLGTAQFALQRPVEALDTLRQAARHTQATADWLALGIAFDQQGAMDEALHAAERVLRAEPAGVQARLLRARCLGALGRTAAAAQDYRHLLRHGVARARAWFALLDLKTEPIDATELAALEQAERAAVSMEDRGLLGFALGRAFEAHARYDEAFATFVRANAAVAPGRPWDARAFDARVDAIERAAPHIAADAGDGRGREVIFLVGLPRSGSTLVEQVLAAHPEVEGASELPYLEQVLTRESLRRRRALEHWMPQAEAADWVRLGDEYLALTARWRSRKPRCTDKMPGNWLYAAALQAMLPAARIIDCRRDALETCWSCHKQLFAPGRADFSVRWPDLAAYWRRYRRFADAMSQRWPQRVRTFAYEALVTTPDAFVRELLAFCDLPFDAACIRPHQAQRSIRTASAAQVRQPIHRVAVRAELYGALLEPLRRELEREDGARSA